MCKVDNIEPASNFEDVAQKIQSVKKRKKVSWRLLDCLHELHKSMTSSTFATLTHEGEEQVLDEDERSVGGDGHLALNTAGQATVAKRKVNTRKNIDLLVKVQKVLLWRTVSTAIDSGACDTVISTEHVPDHEVHESVESWLGENFHSATREPIPDLGGLRLPLYLREGTVRGMVMRAALVTKL